jgi:asparagine synthase (glutamine-hydrolysing)
VSGVGVVVDAGGGPVGEVVAALTSPVGHRGSVGSWTGPGVGVASLGGRPAVHEAAGVVAVADVRLDNRGELVRLLGVGEDPSDVELVLGAYLRWGAGCAARLLGDFAFVVWDQRRRRLVAARDAMGMRALYWHRSGARVLVGTEIKQLLAAGVPARLFEPALAAHLAGIFAPLAWTCFEGIEALPPAHVLEVDERGARTWRFWEVDPDRRIRYRDERDYAEHLRWLLLDAVRARLRGPGPVGIMLSGGMDSGAVASTAGWLREQDPGLPELRAYCWAFEELTECDERHVSRHITDRYGITEVAVEADDAWPLKDYPRHGPDPDDPFLGVYQPLIDRTLARARDDGVTTLLGGDRGDLVNGPVGLDYVSSVVRGRWRRLAGDLRDHRRSTGEGLPTIVRTDLVAPIAAWARRAPLRTLPRRLATAARPAQTPGSAAPPWTPRVSRLVAEVSEAAAREGAPPTGFDRARHLRYEAVFTPLHMRGVVWSERGYARYGLGFADPWSDRRLAEFALAIPPAVITRPGSTDKRLARSAVRGLMPERARARVAKTLPSPLSHRGLRDREVDTVHGLLHSPRVAALGLIDPSSARTAFAAYLDGAPMPAELWWTLSLEMWLCVHAR